jgi:hypothetical protein
MKMARRLKIIVIGGRFKKMGPWWPLKIEKAFNLEVIFVWSTAMRAAGNNKSKQD